MNANIPATDFGRFNKDKIKAFFYWTLVGIALFALYAAFAKASGAGGGTSLQELNTWLEDELGGSIGTAIGLVAFLVGLIAAVSTRQFMPLIWGMGIGVTLGIFLNVVTTATGAGLPITLYIPSLPLA